MVTAKALRARLDYNPETGIFKWKDSKTTPRNRGKVAGWVNSDGYVCIEIDYKEYKAHRLAWLYIYGKWPKGQTDHENLIRSDNRIKNLREATQSQNQINMGLPKRNTSGFKGAFWIKDHQKWSARIHMDGKQRHLGYFNSAEEAHAAYMKAARARHGEFARSAVRIE